MNFWNSNKLYLPKKSDSPNEDKKFYMLAPPPNVTGALHLGHALTTSIQDVYSRWYRMRGYEVNWVPGIDHAGISTQVIVEKKIFKEKNINRHQIGRENFIEEVWSWKTNKESVISNQQKRLGASMNWDNEYFTMDKNHSKVVNDAFIQLFNDGLVYRETKIVNWCCALQSVISDIEVDHIDLNEPTYLSVPNHKIKVLFGVLYKFQYNVVDSNRNPIGSLDIETTRPETILGDAAIAIHPKDNRYEKFHGKFCIHPVSNELIPIILDEILVDMSFGTGAVKVTPSHDINDYYCGKRNGVNFVSIFSPEGKVTCSIPNSSSFNGLSRWNARTAMIEYMSKIGQYKGNTSDRNEKFQTSISICSRSGDIIEPMLFPQWYIKTKKLAETSMNYVRNKELKIVPEKYESDWFKWLENIQDWCISRQLWWGHRIPAYRVSINPDKIKSILPEIKPPHEIWLAANSPEEAIDIAVTKHEEFRNIDRLNLIAEQDSDVLDTWFSSGLLPLSCFNFSNSMNNLKTGNDILFFWVARMTMLSSYFSQCLPFKTVLLHPMIRDSNGRKMSKSLGNVLDPLDVINGATLTDLKNSVISGLLSQKETKMLYHTSKRIQESLENHRTGMSAEAIKNFLLKDLCESFIDFIKPVFFKKIDSSSQVFILSQT
ncbi:putative valine-tRNA ligase, cytoplasmic [Smittium culicis]|uniref:valine--tRNA ligase n=1 Tax=Smittium culicis TaxID=133412 RepID=A0A1R1XQX1_9FUNG|nr:putative valine-tRNA ligase, cytoplasmic [Smittium culicis]